MFTSRLTVAMAFLTLAAAAVAAVVADDPTPALALVGAFVLAIIAAETAETRQVRQTAADAERQTRALDAERERHLATLAHDRELADVADLRALLDKAAVALHHGDQAIGRVKIAYTQHGRSMPEQDPDARRELNAAGQELDAVGARLSVRLGRYEDAVQAFRAAADAALEVSREVGWLEDDRPEDTRRKHAAIDTSRAAYTAAARRFIAAAVEVAGMRRDDGTTPAETT